MPVTAIGNYAFARHYAGLTSLAIPESVTSIGDQAFVGCASLTSLTIPSSVTRVGQHLFDFCPGLTGVFFRGNAPSYDLPVVGGLSTPTAYYLSGTAGWDVPFADLSTVLWNPQVQTGDGSFGVLSNHFGFNTTGTTNIPVVVEACPNLTLADWTPLQSCVITNGSIYFSDPAWTNYPTRLYRIRSP